MNRRLAFIAGLSVLSIARAVSAQQAEVTIGYQGLPYKSASESNTGINLAEGVLMHVGVGAEGGYDSNVFYGSSDVPGAVVPSGILRFSGFAEITNATRGGATPSGLVYNARAGLLFRRYTSTDPTVEKYQNAFMPSAGLTLNSTSGPWAFLLSDTFVRVEDAPYQGSAATGPLTRDSNLASLQSQWSPGGGRITMTLRYNNIIDIFEADSGFSYANNLTNQLMFDVSWKWLPKTAVFLQASQGWVTYLKSNTNGKVDSYPLLVVAGIRGLVTQKTSAVLALGYTNGFYSSGVTTGGILGNSYVDLQLRITPTLLSRVVLGYRQNFANSVISQFYYDYSVYASYVQQILGRLGLDISGRFSYRDYQGLLFDKSGQPRTDKSVIVGATLDYFIRNWAYAGAGYSLAANFSDYALPVSGLPVSYVKHQVFARLGFSY